MKYLIALLVTTSSFAMKPNFDQQPKKINIPQQKSTRIVLKRSGLSIRSSLCDLGKEEFKADLHTVKVIDKAIRTIKHIDRNQKNQMILDFLRDFGQ